MTYIKWVYPPRSIMVYLTFKSYYISTLILVFDNISSNDLCTSLHYRYGSISHEETAISYITVCFASATLWDECSFWQNNSRQITRHMTKYRGIQFVSDISKWLLPEIYVSSGCPCIFRVNIVSMDLSSYASKCHDDVIKWKHFPRYWPFARGIHRSPVNSPHKGQWRGALMFSLIWVWMNGWVNNREAGD